MNDRLDAAVLRTLAEGGTRLVALRSAGFNHVDLAAAAALGITVVRVPAYSPHAVAEHTLALILALNRTFHAPSPASATATSPSTAWSASTSTADRGVVGTARSASASCACSRASAAASDLRSGQSAEAAALGATA